jgi:Flp pilus assembly protein TadD
MLRNKKLLWQSAGVSLSVMLWCTSSYAALPVYDDPLGKDVSTIALRLRLRAQDTAFDSNGMTTRNGMDRQAFAEEAFARHDQASVLLSYHTYHVARRPAAKNALPKNAGPKNAGPKNAENLPWREISFSSPVPVTVARPSSRTGRPEMRVASAAPSSPPKIEKTPEPRANRQAKGEAVIRPVSSRETAHLAAPPSPDRSVASLMKESAPAKNTTETLPWASAKTTPAAASVMIVATSTATLAEDSEGLLSLPAVALPASQENAPKTVSPSNALAIPVPSQTQPAIPVIGGGEMPVRDKPAEDTQALPLPEPKSAVAAAPNPVASDASRPAIAIPAVLEPAPQAETDTRLSSKKPVLPVASPQASQLSEESKRIAEHLPAEIEKEAHVPSRKHPVLIQHLEKKDGTDEIEIKKHKGLGISITVKRPRADVNHWLEEAYEALIHGQREAAVDLYKEALAIQPSNTMALFGLATTYHRGGDLAQARLLYGRLLAIDPQNVEGLNNFLVLLSDEAPAEALKELNKLEMTHPHFSPIPAQKAAIYEKAGDFNNAVSAMQRALMISPDNLKYRYNMAVILDRAGATEDAEAFYKQLLIAAERGEILPAKPEEIQERLTFLRSNHHS